MKTFSRAVYWLTDHPGIAITLGAVLCVVIAAASFNSAGCSAATPC